MPRVPTVEDQHARAPGSDALEVGGHSVAPPLTAGQARALAGEGLLADDVAGLQKVWQRLVSLWDEEVTAARADPGQDRLDQAVGGEWSFLQTLRHLAFVTDAWVGAGVAGSRVHHPLGLPPHFVTNGQEMGLALEAGPGLEEVLDARRSRQEIVTVALEAVTDLDASCAGRLSGFTRRGAFQMVVAEEWFHLGFARRDLGALRSS